MNDGCLMTLQEACDLVFGGNVKVSTLRAEIARGRLTVFRVGRKHFTTPKHVREMVERCRVAGPPHVYTSIVTETPGSSETVQHTSARAALERTLLGLKNPSPPISGTSTGQPIPPHLRSSMSS